MHRTRRNMVCAALWLALATLAFFAAPALPDARAQEAATPWEKGSQSRARLIVGGFKDGVYRVGVEIALDGDAHTYWRFPGDAGAPPVFDFSRSQNVASVEVRYPAPVRIPENGMDVYGYHGEVIFPLIVTPKDAHAPVSLSVHLDYAACEKICVPARAEMLFSLPRESDHVALSRIADYEAQAPRPGASAGAPKLTLTPIAASDKAGQKPSDKQGDKPQWRVVVTPDPGKEADLFAEAPEGWYFETRRAPDGAFVLTQAQAPAASSPDAGKAPSVRLTLTAAQGAFDYPDALAARPLDGGARAP